MKRDAFRASPVRGRLGAAAAISGAVEEGEEADKRRSPGEKHRGNRTTHEKTEEKTMLEEEACPTGRGEEALHMLLASEGGTTKMLTEKR